MHVNVKHLILLERDMTKAIDTKHFQWSCLRLLLILAMGTAAGLMLEPELPGALVGGWVAFILTLDGCLLAHRGNLNIGHAFYRDFPFVISFVLGKILTKAILFKHWLDRACFRPVRLWIRAVIHWLIALLFCRQAARTEGPAYESIGSASFFIILPHSLPLRSPPFIASTR